MFRLESLLNVDIITSSLTGYSFYSSAQKILKHLKESHPWLFEHWKSYVKLKFLTLKPLAIIR